MSLSISRAPPHLVKISMLKDVETQIAAVESDRPNVVTSWRSKTLGTIRERHELLPRWESEINRRYLHLNIR